MSSEPTPLPPLEAFETWAVLFPASDDAPWQAWIDMARPSAAVLFEHLRANYRWEIKARILALLLVPDSAMLPRRFHPTAGIALTSYEIDASGSEPFPLGIFPRELILFAQDLVCESLDKLDQFPIHFDERRCKHLRDWLGSWLWRFMGILSPTESQKSCDRCSLSDHHRSNTSEGRNLDFFKLHALLTSGSVPLEHKRAILQREVHPLIERECEQASEGENVEPIYTRMFQTALYDRIKSGNGSNMPSELVREEMDFLLRTLPVKLGWLNIGFDHDLPYLLRIYEGEEFLARRKALVLRAFEEARVRDEEPTGHLGARWKIGVLNEARYELGEEHPELKALLKRLMEEALPGILANEELEQKLKKIYEDLR